MPEQFCQETDCNRVATHPSCWKPDGLQKVFTWAHGQAKPEAKKSPVNAGLFGENMDSG
jgi:hypothetical protein